MNLNKFKCPQKIVSILLTLILLLSIMAVAPITAGAYWDDWYSTYDGLWDFVTYNDEAYIIYYNGTEDNITIPSQVTVDDVNYYDVVGVGYPDEGDGDGYGLLYYNYYYSDYDAGEVSITIPEGVTTIGEYIFNGNDCGVIGYISIPSTVSDVLEGAICNNTALTRVDFYSTTTDIHESAFYGNPELTIYGYEGSDIQTYATTPNPSTIPFAILSDDPAPVTNPLDQSYSTPITAGSVTDGNSFNLSSDLEYTQGTLLGAQVKTGNTNGVRFIAELSSDIISNLVNSDDYGFVVGKCSYTSTAEAGASNIESVTKNMSGAVTASCKGSTNNIVDGYGKNDGEDPTAYKYVTLLVNGIDSTQLDQGFVVRFYYTKGDTTYYANYTPSGSVTSYRGMCASYNSLV